MPLRRAAVPQGASQRPVAARGTRGVSREQAAPGGYWCPVITPSARGVPEKGIPRSQCSSAACDNDNTETKITHTPGALARSLQHRRNCARIDNPPGVVKDVCPCLKLRSPRASRAPDARTRASAGHPKRETQQPSSWDALRVRVSLKRYSKCQRPEARIPKSARTACIVRPKRRKPGTLSRVGPAVPFYTQV